MKPEETAKVADVFIELFNLLEEYAPAWYTEEHHQRAMAALQVLRDTPSHGVQIHAKRGAELLPPRGTRVL